MGLRDELESIAATCAAQGFWSDGWLAVKHTRFYHEKDTKSESYARLSRLEELLRPQTLVERVRGRVLASKSLCDIDEIDADDPDSYRPAMEHRQAESKALGSEVANEPTALHELLSDIVGCGGNLWYFGMGLAQTAKSPS